MSSVKIGDLQINEEGNVFTWEISKYLIMLQNYKVVVSDTFNFSNDDEKGFQLELHHCTKNPNPPNCQPATACMCDDVWRLVLRSIEQGSSFDRWKCTISVIRNENILTSRKDDVFRTFVSKSEEAILNFCPNYVPEFLSKKDNIKIQCKLKCEIDDMTKKLGKRFDFERMFLDKKFSDILLRTKCGKEIPAHRILLATESPVFEAMFTHDMMENKCQLVDIVDISYDTVVEMVRYIYTGSLKTQELSTMIELLAAADKYQIQELKIKCEHILGSKLSIENAVDTLRIADTYNSDRLIKKAVDFVKQQLIGTLPLNEIKDMLLGKKGNET